MARGRARVSPAPAAPGVDYNALPPLSEEHVKDGTRLVVLREGAWVEATATCLSARSGEINVALGGKWRNMPRAWVRLAP